LLSAFVLNDYWTVLFGAQELIKKAFDEHRVGMSEPHFYITQRHNPTTAIA